MSTSLMPIHHLQVTDNSAGRSVFSSFGEQLQAVARCAATGRRDPRLDEVHTRALARIELEARTAGVPLAAGASEQVPSDGGFLVEPEFARELVRRMYLTGDIYRRCMELPCRSGNIRFPQINETTRVTGSRLGGVQVWWQNEASAGIKMWPGFRLSELTPQRLTGFMQLSDELSMDSNAMDTWATYAFSTELLFTLENAIVNGTGAGQPMGVLNCPALVTVSALTGQASASVVNQNVLQMTSQLWAAGRKTAVWLYNQNLLPQLSSLTTVVGAAGSQSNAWHYAEDEGQPDTLCGIPAYPSEYCQAPGTPGDLILADFSRYVVALRERLLREMSIHLYFNLDTSVFRFISRIDGAPLDNSAITPLYGANPTSPFVALAQR